MILYTVDTGVWRNCHVLNLLRTGDLRLTELDEWSTNGIVCVDDRLVILNDQELLQFDC